MQIIFYTFIIGLPSGLSVDTSIVGSGSPFALQGDCVGGGGVCVVSGVRGKLSSGASGWRMSYRNSGIIGTVSEKKVEEE